MCSHLSEILDLRYTVASELSPIFLPTSLSVHSSVFDLSPPELIPGTTRGILRVLLVVKFLIGSICFCWILVLVRKEVRLLFDEEHKLYLRWI